LYREEREIEADLLFEQTEFAGIYVKRGLDAALAAEVASQLMNHDAVGAHARDELSISDITSARPVQAAFASAGSFFLGGLLPLLMVFFVPHDLLVIWVFGSSMTFLGMMGALAAYTGGAEAWRGAARCIVWGALAMGVTDGIGTLIGKAL
jgi:vacuolar iron transporter family protein